MTNLGTYSTIDYPNGPANVGVSALDFLMEEFAKIGGTVRVVSNPHDFGEYPSFEIDYPDLVSEAIDFLDVHEDDDSENPVIPQEELDAQQKIVDDWHDEANRIEAEYNKKFSQYL